MSEIKKYFLKPGVIFVSKDEYELETILGSCISVCLIDIRKKIGGMNHYIYSGIGHIEKNGRYGLASIPYMIKLMQSYGCFISDIRAFIAGGASDKNLSTLVADENALVARKVLKKYGIKILKEDVGGKVGRKIIFNNYTGEFFVQKFSG